MHKASKKWSVLLIALALFAAVAAACQAAPDTTTTDGGAGADEEVSALQTQIADMEAGGAGDEAIANAQATIDALEAAAAEEVEATEPPAEAVDRNGGWFDTIVVVEEPDPDRGIERMLAGDVDIYMFATGDPTVYNKIVENDDALDWVTSYGNYNELTFNPSGPEFANGELNPFSNPVIREAMNMVVDRNHIAQEIYGGLATPRFTSLGTVSSDYVTFVDLMRSIESKYAYNLDAAREIIAAEMEGMGATLEDEVWTYNGEPVTIIFLIRTEDRRRDIGDYVSNQLEEIGFTVDRRYSTAAEASACWINTDPTEGCFHMYTGGWISTAISRDEGSNFGFFYTPLGGIGIPAGAYTPTEDFQTVADALWVNDFSTLQERRELFEQAIVLSLENSQRVFLIDQNSVTGYLTELQASGDLSGGVSGSQLWAMTLRRQGEVGGALNIAMPSILTQPWNPLQGSNWIYDAALYRATGEFATVSDPFTGLARPNRIERAEVVVEEGLPVGSTLDWVSLDTAAEIPVPEDAWADWNAETQTWITVAEKFPEGTTAKAKVTVYYPEDLFDTVTWHDGSPLSMGDFLMSMIVGIDQAKEASPIYDEAQVPAVEAFLGSFKGVKIISTDPLVFESYTDAYQLDAENLAGAWTWWPMYAQGQGAWHMMAIGMMADAAGLAAFSPDKAAANEVEQLSYIAGPTLTILTEQLALAVEGNLLPYEPTFSEYVTAEEATARYAALQEWFRIRGHYWVNTGPYFMRNAFPVEGNVILSHNPNYSDRSDRWAAFSQAPIPVVTLDGPSDVTIGEEATFTVNVSFNDEPYAAEDITRVVYLVFDAEGNLALQGEAEGGEGGAWTVSFDTSDLPEGANRIEVVVVSNRVGLPRFASQQFVTTE